MGGWIWILIIGSGAQCMYADTCSNVDTADKPKQEVEELVPVEAEYSQEAAPIENDCDSKDCVFCPDPIAVCSVKQHPLLEVKAGYFFFTQQDMRRVYNQGGIDLQLCGSYPVYKLLHVYGSVEYLERSGKSIGGHQKTSIWEIPISAGLRPVFPIGDHVEYYLTLGPRYFFVHAHNRSSYVSKKMEANGCGAFANTGFLFIIGKYFTVDLFGEYSYKRLHFHTGKEGASGHTVQVGGLTFGGGLGYSF